LDHAANRTKHNEDAEHELTGTLFANRAAALLALHRNEEAETDCRRALQRCASAKLLARCAVACHRQKTAAGAADAFGCVAEALLLEPQHAGARRVLGDLRATDRGRLLRPDADYVAKIKARAKRRGAAGMLGYAIAYYDALRLLAPEESTDLVRDVSRWNTALAGRIPEPIAAAPAAANSPNMDPTSTTVNA
jgi:hypothetical protein